MKIDRRLVVGGLAATTIGPAATAQPVSSTDEVVIFAAGAVQKPMEDILSFFEKHTGNKPKVSFDTVGALKKRVIDGESPDILMLSAAAMQELSEAGKIARKQHASVGRTPVGLCNQLTAPELDITTSDKLKAVLLAAPSIAHADPARGATAGTHFRKVLQDLGILDQIASKVTVVPFGGAIPGRVAKGEFAIGISQATEIIPVKEVRYLGSLPEPHALWTTYSIGSVKGLRMPDSAAAELAVIIISEVGQSVFKTYGFVQ